MHPVSNKYKLGVFIFLKYEFKVLKIRYTLMERYLVDIYLLSEAFGGDWIWNFDIKPEDGATIVTYFGKFQVDYWVKLRDKDGKWIGSLAAENKASYSLVFSDIEYWQNIAGR